MKTKITKIAASALLLAICIASPAKAQVNAGIIGGINTSAVEVRNLDNRFANETMDGKNITGYEVGAFLKLKAGPVYLKPALMYNYSRGKVTANNQDAIFKIQKVAVPVMFGLHLVGPLNIEAGPVYNYVTNVTEQYNSTNITLARNGIGYRAGLAFEFGLLMINASYEGMTYPTTTGQTTFKEPYKFILGAGLKFGGDGK
ncbi:MAG: hypothetical protein IAF38_19335 [Bacteroidia bacterium]|nr:hypothetical protein [Bacteroidia bacterium]